MKRFFIFLPVFLLAAGCIRIQPKNAGPDRAVPAVALREPGIAPSGRKERQLHLSIMQQIDTGEIRWEDISRYPAPEQTWREERFRLLRPECGLRSEDFSLKKVIVLPRGRRRFVYSFLPLRVTYDGRSAWDTRASFEFDEENQIADIRLSSELIPRVSTDLFRLPASDCNAVSAVVLKKLFTLRLPDGVRTKEKYRFCYPVNGANEKFHDHLRPRARIPELDPTEEYPNFPLPFEKGRYRSFGHGAFYYYAGIVLPVSENEVWVFDTAIRYAGGETRGAFFKLKKGLLFWEIVVESEYDAPSRAVREREQP